MSGPYFSDEQLAWAGRVIGVALMLAGFAAALDSLDRTPSSFTGGSIWGFLTPVHISVMAGCLLLTKAALLDGERRRPDWASGVAVLGLLVAVAFAFKAADARVIWGRGEEGVWGSLYTLASMTPFAMFLALPSGDLGRPLGGPSAWGMAAGAAVILVAIGIGVHTAKQDPFGSFWPFVNAGLTPAAFGVLLVLTSSPLKTSKRDLRLSAIAVAGVVLVAGIGYAVDFADRFDFQDLEWFLISSVSARVALALFILAALGAARVQLVLPIAVLAAVATTANSVRLMTAGDVEFDLVIFVYIALNGIVIPMLAVLCAAILVEPGRGVSGQPSLPASAVS